MPEKPAAAPAPGAPPPAGITLSPMQQRVLDALSERSRELSDMYFGAVAARQQSGNPDRLPQAAHSIRELIEKAPKHLDLNVPWSKRPSLNQMMIDHGSKWRAVKKKSANHTDGEWEGEIDWHLQLFLKETGRLVAFYEETHVTRIAQASTIVCQLDPSRERLPNPLQKLRAQEWHDINDFFTAVSHHRTAVSEAEFDGWMEAFEKFLLSGWRPETAVDQQALKRIIEEGEADA